MRGRRARSGTHCQRERKPHLPLIPSPAPHPPHTGMTPTQRAAGAGAAAAARVRRQPDDTDMTAQGTGVGAGADGVGRAAGSGVGVRARTRVGGVVPSGRVGRRGLAALQLGPFFQQPTPRASRPRRGSSGAPPWPRACRLGGRDRVRRWERWGASSLKNRTKGFRRLAWLREGTTHLPGTREGRGGRAECPYTAACWARYE